MTSSNDDERQVPSGSNKPKVKTRRPGETPFRQQRLKAYQPIVTPKTALPLFFAIAFIFAPIGGLLLYASAKVQELTIDYTQCVNLATSNFTAVPSDSYQALFKNFLSSRAGPRWKYVNDTSKPVWSQNICTIEFTLPNDLHPPVLFYYRLTNFHQNHRRYSTSRDDDQLAGEAVALSNMLESEDCNPLYSDENNKPYYPCGLIANSMFNDTFSSPVHFFSASETGGFEGYNYTYVMSNKGIAWPSDKDLYKKTDYLPSQVSPPPNWALRFPEGYTEENMPNLGEWEEFQVWMRVAGLPTFGKLALRNDTTVFPSGTYEVNITSNFPVLPYHGTKSLVISTRTVMGGKNPFLGIAYVIVSGICILLGFLITGRHLISPRKLGDDNYLSWVKEQRHNEHEQRSEATLVGQAL
ncbi:alkylphosphocholine resistance protein lem3 [Rhizina undulata]